MTETSSQIMSPNQTLTEARLPVPIDALRARTAGALATPQYQLTPQEAKLVSGIQAAFSQASGLTNLDLYLRCKEATLLFLKQGLPVTPTVQPMAEGKGSAPLLAILSGTGEILIQCPEQAGAQSLAGLLVKTAGELVESREREELMMEEIAADWESLDALCEISTDVFSANTVKDCTHRLIQRLACLKEGFNGALFLLEGADKGSVFTADGASKTMFAADLGPLQRALKERTTLVMNGLPAGFLKAASNTQGDIVCWSGARCLAAVPMLSRESIRGFVLVWSETPEHHIDTSFQHLIDALSNRVSMLLECEALTQSVRNNELLEQELEIASTIQNTLLCGEVPTGMPGVTFAALSIPSRTIDGDFYDFYQQREGTIDVLIGDVMGKGVAAALLGTAVKNEFIKAVVAQATAADSERSHPDVIVQQVSRKLNARLIEVERFVTLSYARLCMSKRTLEYVDCGHTNTVVHRKKCLHSFVLQGESLPLGIDLKDKPSQREIEFEPGDTFLFYSDGVTENASPSGELFGLERLVECVEQWSSCEPSILVDQLCLEARRHSGKELFADDFTAVAVKISIDRSDPRPGRKARFVRDLNELAAVREWLVAAASDVGEHGLNEESVTRLLLVCVEAFDNSVIHAEASALNSPVEMDACIFGDSITIGFETAGPDYDPFHVKPPSFDGSRDNGFGLYIMLRAADEFAYEHRPEGINRLTFSILQRKEETNCHADNGYANQ